MNEKKIVVKLIKQFNEDEELKQAIDTIVEILKNRYQPERFLNITMEMINARYHGLSWAELAESSKDALKAVLIMSEASDSIKDILAKYESDEE